MPKKSKKNVDEDIKQTYKEEKMVVDLELNVKKEEFKKKKKRHTKIDV